MSAQLPNVILVTGNDLPQITAEAERLAVQLAGENPSPFDLDIYSQGEEGPTPLLISQLLQAVLTPPFLGGKKTIWLKHFTGFPAEEGAKASKPEGQILKRLAETIQGGLPEQVYLLMDGEGCDGRKGLYKACASRGEVRCFNRPDTRKDGKWQQEMYDCLQAAASAKGMRPLSRAVCENLVGAIGADTAAIDSQLEKIICFYGNPQAEIDPDDLLILCPGHGEEQFFALTNALGAKDLNKALSSINNYLACTDNPDFAARGLLTNTVNYLRQLLRVSLFMAENRLRRPDDLKAFLENLPLETKNQRKSEDELYGYHPFRALKLAEQALRFSPHELIQGLRICRDAAWQCNSSGISSQLALENATIQILKR